MTRIDGQTDRQTRDIFYTQMSENKRETPKKRRSKGVGRPSTEPHVENLSHRGARYAFPNVGIKVRVLLGLKSDIASRGRYYFHPESRSLSNGLSSFLPFWPEEWSRKRIEERRGEGKKRRASNLFLAFRLTLSNRNDRPSGIPLLKD